MQDNPWSFLIGSENPIQAGRPVTFNLTIPVPSGEII